MLMNECIVHKSKYKNGPNKRENQLVLFDIVWACYIYIKKRMYGHVYGRWSVGWLF